jgi:hypothetical protein
MLGKGLGAGVSKAYRILMVREEACQEPLAKAEGLAKGLAQRKFLSSGLLATSKGCDKSSSGTGYKKVRMPP